VHTAHPRSHRPPPLASAQAPSRNPPTIPKRTRTPTNPQTAISLQTANIHRDNAQTLTGPALRLKHLHNVQFLFVFMFLFMPTREALA
jgi:hypothetical protein